MDKMKQKHKAMMTWRVTVDRQLAAQKATTLKLELQTLDLYMKATKFQLDSRISEAKYCMQRLTKIIANPRNKNVLSDLRLNYEMFLFYIVQCQTTQCHLEKTHKELRDRLSQDASIDMSEVVIIFPDFPEFYKQVSPKSGHESNVSSPNSRGTFHPYSKQKTTGAVPNPTTSRKYQAIINESQARLSKCRDSLSEHQTVLKEYQVFLRKHNVFLRDFEEILNESKGISTFSEALVKVSTKLSENEAFLIRHEANLAHHECFLNLHHSHILYHEITLTKHQAFLDKYMDFLKEHAAFLIEHQAKFGSPNDLCSIFFAEICADLMDIKTEEEFVEYLTQNNLLAALDNDATLTESKQ